MREFLTALRESGGVTVSTEPPPDLDADVAELLREHESQFRPELSGEPPELAVEAAYWGCKKLYQACQLLTMRDAPAALGREVLSEPYAGPRGPSSDYAVDLTLSYLPSLLRLAERVAPADPVLDTVRELASSWPLSSVGMSGIPCPSTLPFWENASLRALYVDRIIERRDTVRLDDPRVARAVRSALGAYPELAPKIAAHLESSPA